MCKAIAGLLALLAAGGPTQEAASEVEVKAEGILVGGKTVAPLEGWKPISTPGPKSGPMLLRPLLEALQADPRGGAGRASALRLAVDRDAPYELLTKVLFTAGQAGYEHILFAVGPDGSRAVPLELPRLDAGWPAGSLNLTLAVIPRGLLLVGAGGRLEPETEADGKVGDPAAPTLGLLPGAGCAWDRRPTSAACLDLVRLQRTLRKVKDAFPDERRIALVADPDFRFGDLVAVMDAVRGPADRPLFPEVMLSAGVE